MYHAAAFTLGTVAGVMTLSGIAILIYRRRTTGPVFSATTRNDKGMYVLLVAALVAGLATTVLGNITGHPHDYRLTVAPYFRSIFYLHPTRQPHHPSPDRIPDPRHDRLGAVRGLAVHPPRARLLRAGRLPHPSLHRLPLPRRHRRPPGPARMGTHRNPAHQPERQGPLMQKISLDAAAHEQLEIARNTAAARSSATVFGGHEHALRQTVVALLAGASLGEHENPGEATVHVLGGRVN